MHFWTIFNEPNFGEDLGPQALGGSKTPYAPMLYRKILNAGWSALHATGHGHDTILIGGYAARGFWGGKFPGNFAQTKPLLFIRYLYCVDKSNQQVRGKTAKSWGCPANKAASRKFRKQNPALFSASGMADHPYPDHGSPLNDGKGDPNWATFPDLGRFATLLDKMTHMYGSGKHFPVYNDEYGYITRPPANRSPAGGLYVTPTTAATYINQAEYLSWKNRRLQSYMQYLIRDPSHAAGPYAGFASGLEFPNGLRKPIYFGLQPPGVDAEDARSHAVTRPRSGARHGRLASRGTRRCRSSSRRPAPHSRRSQTVKKLSAAGYFDMKMKFPSSGFVRLAFTYNHDPLLPPGVGGSTITSRVLTIKVR